jgi:two-component system sensor histidine kinase RpfC
MCSLLLVDDNVRLLEFYGLVLEQAGHQVRIAETCARAVTLLKEIDPEIVIMDLRLPKMEDGLGLIRALKNYVRPRGKAPLKVVVVSGWTEDLLDTAEKDAVDCVLPKPVRMEVLLQSIARLALTA